jgi:hypothetical protein
LDPAEEPTGRPIPTPRDPTELGEAVLAPLHRLTDPPQPRLLLATAGGPQAEARRPGSAPGRSVAVGPIGPRLRQAPWVDRGHRLLRLGWLDDHRLQDILGLAAVGSVGPRDHHPQRQGSVVAGQMQRRAALAPVHRRGAGLFTPCFDGFFEPSMRTWSQLMPCRCS